MTRKKRKKNFPYEQIGFLVAVLCVVAQMIIFL